MQLSIVKSLCISLIDLSVIEVRVNREIVEICCDLWLCYKSTFDMLEV